MMVANELPMVMIVDDEPQVLAALADTLEDAFRVVTVSSAGPAIRVLEREQELSVVISDQRMPGLSGHEFLSRAREISDAARILITGHADLDAVIAAVNSGRIFGYIAKPWDRDKLRHLICQAADHCALQRALADEQRLLRNLLDNIPDAIYFKDNQRRFLRSNRAHAAALGLADPDAAIGKTLGDFLGSAEAEALEAQDKRVLELDVPITDTLARPAADGLGVTWLATTRAPVHDDKGQVAGLVAIARDVSGIKEKEERLQSALAEKDLLLGEIHHRVKNNLQVVYSLLALQSDRLVDPTALELLRDSQNRVRSMALIHQTLHESGDFGAVDFAGFLNTLAPTLFASYGVDSRRVALTIDVANVSLPIKTAMPCGLLVNELIANALKHAFPGGRQGEIRISLAPEENGQVVLAVSDNGVGIAADIDLEQSDTMGLQLVGLLADQLGATKTIERGNPTQFVLRFARQ